MGFLALTPEQRAEVRAKGMAAQARSKDVNALLDEFGLPDKMDKAQLEAVGQRCLDAPVSMRRRYLKAMRGKSMAAGVAAHCFECNGWERDGPAQCTSPACPLFPYRPGR